MPVSSATYRPFSSANGESRRRKFSWMRHPAVARLAIILFLFVLWEIAARWFVDPLFLSPPSRVMASLGPLLGSPGIGKALGLTLWELSAAFALSVVIGLAVGLA